ncbi:MAG: hypothetical protein HY815_31170 [Candidatus Riflebacteria bacterium]|nr:hypothetical protein [Candidatus Riflebacteria bacterium]
MRPGVPLVWLLLLALPCSLLAAEPAERRTIAGDPDATTHGLAHFKHVIRAIHEYKGQVYVGTYGSGLYSIGSEGVKQYTTGTAPLLEDRVNVLGVRKDELWIGTCAGFNVFDGQRWTGTQTVKDGVADNVYHSVVMDPKSDRIWVGTSGKGVCVRQDGRWRTFAPKDGIHEGWINGMALDRSGQLWVTTHSSLVRQDGDRFKEEIPPWRFAPAGPTTVVGRGSEVWAGSAFGGLTMYQSGTWYCPPGNAKLPSMQINALAVGDDDHLWIATDRGLTRYCPECGWRTYKKEKGLKDENIRSLHYSPASRRLWAGSFVEGSLYLYDSVSDRFGCIMTAGVPTEQNKNWLMNRRRR